MQWGKGPLCYTSSGGSIILSSCCSFLNFMQSGTNQESSPEIRWPLFPFSRPRGRFKETEALYCPTPYCHSRAVPYPGSNLPHPRRIFLSVLTGQMLFSRQPILRWRCLHYRPCSYRGDSYRCTAVFLLRWDDRNWTQAVQSCSRLVSHSCHRPNSSS